MTESQLETFNKIHEKRFGYLQRLEVTNHIFETGASRFSVGMQLREDLSPENAALSFLFEDVTELRLGDLNGLMFFSVHISDMSTWQRERTRFKVVEYEHSAFSFYCYSFEFKVV